MSRPRLLLPDSTSARQVLNRTALTRIDWDGKSVMAGEQRLPSTRPIDHRWDRSRGIFFESVRRSIGQDHTWHPSNGIIFADQSTVRRCYATRNMFAPRNSGEQSPPSKPTSRANDLVTDPHKLSSRDVGGNNLMHQLDRQQKAFEVALRTAEDEKEAVRNQAQAEIARARRVAEQRENELHRERTAFERQQREKAQLLSAQEQRLREMSARLDSAVAEQEATILQANQRAQETAERRVAEGMQEARKVEDWAAADIQRYEDKLHDAATALSEELEAHQRTQEDASKQAFAVAFDRVTRELEQGSVHRAKVERADYEAYQQVWDQLWSSSYALSTEILQLYGLLYSRVSEWNRMIRISNFPQKYSDLDRDLKDWLNAASQKDEDLAQRLKDLRSSHAAIRTKLRGLAHDSRSFTKFLRLDKTPSRHAIQFKASSLLNETPLRLTRDRIDQQIAELESSFQTADHNLIREPLRRKLEAERGRRAIVNDLLSAFIQFRSEQALQALRDDAVVERRIFASTEEIKQSIDSAREEWYSHIEHRPLAAENTSLGSQQQIEDRGEYLQRHRKFQHAMGDYVHHARKLDLLQADLGLSDNSADTSAYDAAIENAIIQAQLRSEQILDRLTSSGLSRARRKHNDLSKESITEGPESHRIPSTVRASSKLKGRQSRTETGKSRATVRNTRSARRRQSLSVAKPTDVNRKNERKQTAAGLMKFRPTVARRSSCPAWGNLADDTVGDSIRSESKSTSTHAFSRPLSALLLDPLWKAQSEAAARAKGTSRHVNSDDCESSRSVMSDISGQFSFDNDDECKPSQDPAADSDLDYQLSDSLESLQAAATESSAMSSSASSDGASDEGSDGSGEDAIQQLGYRIPAEQYRSAVISSQSSMAAYWTFRLYRNLDNKAPLVHYCVNLETAEARASEFLNEPIVGFDIEWETYATVAKSSAKQNVSLIQIAADGKIALFHIALFNGDSPEQLIPRSLRTLLESRGCVKAGVNIQGDAYRLRECLSIDMQGQFELSHLYRVVQFSESDPRQVNRKLFNLADQVQNILGLPLKKDEVRVSAWSKRLQVEQTDYAASDAYAGFHLFHALEAKRKRMKPMPPRPAFYEDHQPIQLGNGQLVIPKQATKRKRETSDRAGNVAPPENDDECEEYFDAVEGTGVDGFESVLYPGASQSTAYESSEKDHDEVDDLLASAYQRELASGSRKAPGNGKAVNKGQPAESEALQQAKRWVSAWCAALGPEYNLQVGLPKLHAYHLWHEQSMSCEQVAAVLREPPLRIQTVTSYVMDALQYENLPFREDRVEELLEILPKSVHRRYPKVLRRRNS